MPMEMANFCLSAAALIATSTLWCGHASAVTEQEYSQRCAAARQACDAAASSCKEWRDAFSAHGSVCPGVNAIASANMHGPAQISQAAHSTSNDTKTNDSMAEIRELCTDKTYHRGFLNQTQCTLLVMSESNNVEVQGPYMNLYKSVAVKLIEDVQQKRISEASADIELQKAYLDVLARQSAANESAARVREIEHQQALEEQRLMDESAARALAIEQQRAFEEQRLADEQRTRAQAEENQKAQQAAEQADIEKMRRQCMITMLGRPSGNQAYNGNPYYVNLCKSDPYAHLRPENQPRPQRTTNCFGSSTMVTCTEQ